MHWRGLISCNHCTPIGMKITLRLELLATRRKGILYSMKGKGYSHTEAVSAASAAYKGMQGKGGGGSGTMGEGGGSSSSNGR